MIPNINFLIPIILIIPRILDWLDSIGDEELDMLVCMNILNVITIITNILVFSLEVIEHDSIYDLNPHDLIHLLLGYR